MTRRDVLLITAHQRGDVVRHAQRDTGTAGQRARHAQRDSGLRLYTHPPRSLPKRAAPRSSCGAGAPSCLLSLRAGSSSPSFSSAARAPQNILLFCPFFSFVPSLLSLRAGSSCLFAAVPLRLPLPCPSQTRLHASLPPTAGRCCSVLQLNRQPQASLLDRAAGCLVASEEPASSWSLGSLLARGFTDQH